ncbi:MAG: DUF1800 family protein [Actinomycetota bacterium]|nr:DUF1800 family protein [Actinomycetota bacterium]
MEERDAVACLHRRAGFGLASAEMREAVGRGAAAELDRLLDPQGAGGLPADLWNDALLPSDPRDRASKSHAIGQWVDGMVASEQPAVERVAWMWHGHFVSALDKVRVARLMVEQARLFRSAGLGSFRELLRAVTLDPAMLIYLDLRTSTGSEPNENYARELLELFTLGEGRYTEADVQAGARALTGWTFYDLDGGVKFAPRRHDDTPREFLGVDGVHDLDTVLDAVLAHDELAPFIARTVAAELLGSTDDALVAGLAEGFAAGGFDVRSLVRSALQAGLAGGSAPVVLGPVPWFVCARRVTGAQPPMKDVLPLLRSTGQLPMLPPNVAGWPGGPAWFGASSLVARANLAASVAAATPDGEVLAAAQGDDGDLLADVLGLPSVGFGDDSLAALDAATAGRDRLAVALITPEFLIA